MRRLTWKTGPSSAIPSAPKSWWPTCAASSAARRAEMRAAAARLSARRAALEAAHVCHQLFGALGIVLEGPVFHVSRRIRQLASQAPGEGPAREALLSGLELDGGARR